MLVVVLSVVVVVPRPVCKPTWRGVKARWAAIDQMRRRRGDKLSLVHRPPPPPRSACVCSIGRPVGRRLRGAVGCSTSARAPFSVSFDGGGARVRRSGGGDVKSGDICQLHVRAFVGPMLAIAIAVFAVVAAATNKFGQKSAFAPFFSFVIVIFDDDDARQRPPVVCCSRRCCSCLIRSCRSSFARFRSFVSLTNLISALARARVCMLPPFAVARRRRCHRCRASVSSGRLAQADGARARSMSYFCPEGNSMRAHALITQRQEVAAAATHEARITSDDSQRAAAAATIANDAAAFSCCKRF